MIEIPNLSIEDSLPAFHLDSSTLEKIQQISQIEKSPFYLYRASLIREQCKKFRAIPYENKSIHFATMANISPEFLKIIREEGLKVFVNSIPHLRAVQSLGFQGDDIVFTASAMDESAMRYVYESGAQLNLDSINQLKEWMRLFGDAPVGIRCNIGELVPAKNTHAGYFIGRDSRLGLIWEEIQSLKGAKNIRGLHVYVGTDILDLQYFLTCYEALGKLIPFFPRLEYLNFGGGFGIDESGKDEFPFAEYAEKVTHLMEELSVKAKKTLRLVLEPGRIIGGVSGLFVCRVTDVKKRSHCSFVGVNASSVQFPRPLFYPETASHPVVMIRNGAIVKDDKKQLTSLYGCSTYSRDFLLRGGLLPQSKIGDILVLGNAGSYCTSAFTDFLGFPRPKEYFI
jgi:diaminopimelate decarboxylase